MLACGRAPAPSGMTPPAGFSCPSGTTWKGERAGEVEVHGCRTASGLRTGPHLERYPGGGVAVEGAWLDDQRHGVWTAWFPDGAFRSQVTWAAGVEHGPRRELSSDGRVVEIDMEQGLAVELRGLPAGAPMPEWEAGQRVDGVRYATHASSP